MQKQKNKIINIILNDKNVNYYTKLMILLNTWDYYEDYYIPNRKIMNILKINKCWTIRLLKKLEENNIIHIFYRGRKRYFTFIAKSNNNEIIEEKTHKEDLFDYNWLEED